MEMASQGDFHVLKQRIAQLEFENAALKSAKEHPDVDPSATTAGQKFTTSEEMATEAAVTESCASSHTASSEDDSGTDSDFGDPDTGYLDEDQEPSSDDNDADLEPCSDDGEYHDGKSSCAESCVDDDNDNEYCDNSPMADNRRRRRTDKSDSGPKKRCRTTGRGKQHKNKDKRGNTGLFYQISRPESGPVTTTIPEKDAIADYTTAAARKKKRGSRCLPDIANEMVPKVLTVEGLLQSAHDDYLTGDPLLFVLLHIGHEQDTQAYRTIRQAQIYLGNNEPSDEVLRQRKREAFKIHAKGDEDKFKELQAAFDALRISTRRSLPVPMEIDDGQKTSATRSQSEGSTVCLTKEEERSKTSAESNGQAEVGAENEGQSENEEGNQEELDDQGDTELVPWDTPQRLETASTQMDVAILCQDAQSWSSSTNDDIERDRAARAMDQAMPQPTEGLSPTILDPTEGLTSHRANSQAYDPPPSPAEALTGLSAFHFTPLEPEDPVRDMLDDHVHDQASLQPPSTGLGLYDDDDLGGYDLGGYGHVRSGPECFNRWWSNTPP